MKLSQYTQLCAYTGAETQICFDTIRSSFLSLHSGGEMQICVDTLTARKQSQADISSYALVLKCKSACVRSPLRPYHTLLLFSFPHNGIEVRTHHHCQKLIFLMHIGFFIQICFDFHKMIAYHLSTTSDFLDPTNNVSNLVIFEQALEHSAWKGKRLDAGWDER